jgi:hypothetical protein
LPPAPFPVYLPRSDTKRLQPIKLNLIYFFIALLGPALLTLIVAVLVRTPNEMYSVGVAILGGIAGGIICALLLVLRIKTTLWGRIGLMIPCSAVMIIVCITLCFFGCTTGGYQFRFHE